ncbi:TetR/AcrR family transcriptional regulator [Actinomadura sp. KC06]|uniref:TetR/AcrR family transcriptional regulator n=1 Tax=Actinomadura sp. KC06 TaxID=2530369 RepID=UPI00140512BF|nr:TetR/AcrR family transcriptional regulator [Actinomadura sp. KC06]
MTTVPSRRDRIRAATVAEIKEVARRHLVQGGPAQISLRAIAREMGMTSPALYRYFPSLETLVTVLTGDFYDEVRLVMEEARDAVPKADALTRLRAVSHAFREWAVEHPAEFALMFGAPLPAFSDHLTSTDMAQAACTEAGMRFARVFSNLFNELWFHQPFPIPEPDEIAPDLREQLADVGDRLGGLLPVGAVYVYLSCWTNLYGMVTMETFGHQRWALQDAKPLFDAKLEAMLGRLVPSEVP